MKEEAIDMLKLGASMALLAVLIVYVVQSVLLGKHIQGSAIDKLNTVQVSSESGVLKDLNNCETVMTAPTLLALIQYNQNYIGSVTCYICDASGEERTMDEDVCVISHLRGNVRVYVEYNSGYGLYNLTVRAE